MVARGAWGSLGPTVAPIKSGCNNPMDVPVQFPCELLKAILLIRSKGEREPAKRPSKLTKCRLRSVGDLLVPANSGAVNNGVVNNGAVGQGQAQS